MGKNGVVMRILCISSIFLFVTSAHASEIKKVQPTATPEIQKTQPVAPERPVKPSGTVLPDLVVERVWLDAQSKINFQIKNAGKGEIPDSEHNQGVVKVNYGKGQENFYFIRASSTGKSPVDPKGVLKKPGGSVQYDTKIKVEVPVPVTVVVDEERRIAESNENNNRSAATMLTPPSPSLPKEVKVPLPERKPTVDKATKVAKTVTPAVKKPGSPVLTKVVSGIDIIFPGEGVVLTPGQQFGLRFSNVSTSRATIVHIYLHRIRENGEIGEKIWEQGFTGDSRPVLEPGNTMIMEQRIPESAPEGIYMYDIATEPRRHSWSDPFGVRPVGSRPSIQILTPGGGGEYWKTGSTHAIRWYYLNVGSADPPERWTITLHRVRGIGGSSSDYTKTIGPSIEREWLGDKWRYNYQWHIPQDFTHGDYRISISVEEGKGKGTSVRGEGSLLFTIGGGDWNLKVNRIFTDPVSGNLMAEVINERPTVSGRVDFSVTQIDSVRTSWDVVRTLSGGETEVIDLGKLGSLAGHPPSSGAHLDYRALPTFKVTIDATNRVDEKNEEDNSIEHWVTYYGLVGKVEVTCGGTPMGHLATCRSYPMFITIYNFGSQPVRPIAYISQVWTNDRGQETRRNQIGSIYPEDIKPGEFYTHTVSFGFTAPTGGTSEAVATAETSRIELLAIEPFDTWLTPNPLLIQLRF